MTRGVNGRVAVVTGGAGGIGRAVCAGLAAAGATVVVVDVAGVDAVVADLGAGFGVVADVADPDEVAALMAEVNERFGGPHILVTLAGGALGSPKAFEEIAPEDLARVLDVNVKGTFYCAQAAAPYMADAGGGSIVTVSSIGARQPSSTTGAAYAAAKAAIGGLTRALARELGHSGVRVNAIAPGLILTDQLRERFDAAPDRAEVLDTIALRRVAETREIVEPVLFLAGDGSSFITGVTLDVNGGRYLPS